MPISVTCSCGKALRIKDEWAGRTVTCPSCGGTFVAGGPNAAVNSAAAVYAAGRRSRGESGKGGLAEKFSISPMYIALIAFIILVPTVVFLAKIGPLKAQKQWRELEGQADSDVSTICGRALQVHLQKEGEYDPNDSHWTPGVQAVTFEPSLLMIRLPDSITFTGRCSKGFFHGTYNPKTREVAAKVPGEGTELDVTGHAESNGELKVYIDGEEAKLDYSKKRDKDEIPKSMLPPKIRRK